MISYEVILGVDRAARDTGRRLTLRVREKDPLSAAIEAERQGDCWLEDPQTMYCHAVRVTPVSRPAPMAAPALALAA